MYSLLKNTTHSFHTLVSFENVWLSLPFDSQEIEWCSTKHNEQGDSSPNWFSDYSQYSNQNENQGCNNGHDDGNLKRMIFHVQLTVKDFIDKGWKFLRKYENWAICIWGFGIHLPWKKIYILVIINGPVKYTCFICNLEVVSVNNYFDRPVSLRFFPSQYNNSNCIQHVG